jgi:hypothetical protein
VWARGDLRKEQEDAQAQEGLDEQFAFFGLVPDRPVLPALEPCYLWPENLEAWNLFQSVQSQWRGAGMAREGLDYAGVHRVIGQRRAWRLHRRQRFSELQVMEAAALAEWAERAAKAQPRER